jgi:hypothetical protein
MLKETHPWAVRYQDMFYQDMFFNRPWSGFVPAALLTLSINLRYLRPVVIIGRRRSARP